MTQFHPHVRLAASRAEPFPLGAAEPRETILAYDNATMHDHRARAYTTIAANSSRILSAFCTWRAKVHRDHADQCRRYARHLQRQDGNACSPPHPTPGQ